MSPASVLAMANNKMEPIMKPLPVMLRSKKSGFTLIELMIVVAIIGILAAIAIPAFQNYVKKAAYTEVVTAMGPYKLNVEQCYLELGTLTGCTASSNGVQANPVSTLAGAFNTLTVSNGTIVATPNVYKGILSSETCTFTPVPDVNLRLVWSYSGSCIAKGYVRN